MTPLPQPDLATLHEAIAAELADRPCLVATGRVYSWREITASSRRLAAVLRRSGLGFHAERAVRGRAWTSPHDHLALYLHNGPEYLETLLGAHKARVAPFNTNFRYTVDELAALFADAAPRARWTTTRRSPRRRRRSSSRDRHRTICICCTRGARPARPRE